MNKPDIEMSTDLAWEEWGRRDPYFGVITHPKFRRSAIDDTARHDFFETGQLHVDHVLTTIRKHIDPHFAPSNILDFGCGVGRLLVPFAAIAGDVLGLDVSSSMLKEARQNCDERRLENVRLALSDDELSTLTGEFDLIHSVIVFQHIPIKRGRVLLSKLLRHLRPGGVAAIQLTYSKARYAETHGVAPPESVAAASTSEQLSQDIDPEIQMNPYNMNEILFLVQRLGVGSCHVQFSDHGGELGVFLFFSLPGSSLAR